MRARLAPTILGLAACAAGAFACGDDASPADALPPDAGLDASAPPPDTGPPAPDAGPPSCGTAGGALPAGLETLSHFDDTTMRGALDGQTWSVTLTGATYVLAESVAYEQARFELDRPARIHGFSVQWILPEGTDPATALEAGLYADFGHNGFDMWRPDPLWTGTRCAGDVGTDGWVDYVFETPVELAHPGLVYVAHRREGPGVPSWPFDLSTDDPEASCDDFDHCRASLNLPNAEAGSFFNGVTIQLPYDYLVRLHLEPTGEVPAGGHVFREVPGLSTGQRTAWGDYDHDGFDDFVTGGPRLFRNGGDGAFTDVTDGAGITAAGVTGGGGVWGDYDNDGCLDLFVFSESLTAPDALLRNDCDGTFTDVTAAAGITDAQSYETCGDAANVRSPSPAAAWLDLDADGYLDLYVANFICWSAETYYRDSFFHNRGDGTFEDWSGTRGLSTDRMASRGAAPIDHDRDGDVDLLVNNYRLQRNLFFDNQGDGTFLESAEAKGLAGNSSFPGPAYGHTIGVAWGDVDGDGDFDVVQANLAHPRFYRFSDKTQVLLNRRIRGFSDNAGDWSYPAGDNGLRFQETHSSPVLADFDQDGALDLVITAVYDGRPTDFYWGRGDGTFRLDSFHAGITTENGWGAAVSDYDHDGDLDLAAQALFENRAPSPGTWLQVRVVGGVSANRAAIGATVAVTAGGATRIRHVQGGSGQGCQDSMYLHFGLGEASAVDSILVELPGGRAVTFAGPIAVNQRVWLFEDGTVHLGWAPPP